MYFVNEDPIVLLCSNVGETIIQRELDINRVFPHLNTHDLVQVSGENGKLIVPRFDNVYEPFRVDGHGERFGTHPYTTDLSKVDQVDHRDVMPTGRWVSTFWPAVSTT